MQNNASPTQFGPLFQRARPRANRAGLPALMLTIGIVVLAGAGIVHSVLDTQGKEVERLQTIADLKTHQISDWLTERQRDAELFRMSSAARWQFGTWEQNNEIVGSATLQGLAEHFVSAGTFSAVALFNAEGQRLWGTGNAPSEAAQALQAGMETASRDRGIHRVGPYLGRHGKVRLDFIVPLNNGLGPPLNVVLHADPDGWLYSTLQRWPVPSRSGETLLVRREGNDVVYLNELRHSPGSALKKRAPLTDADLPGAQAVTRVTGPSRVLSGNDYRAVPVVEVARAIPDTDWFLLAKVDRSELYYRAAKEAAWIAVAAGLALFMVGVGFVMLRQRQRLGIAESARQLQAIADSSDDVIFAKDLQPDFDSS